MRIFRYIFTLFAMTLAAGSTFSQQKARKLNVLFIAVDDLNTKIGCYGDDMIKTPNIDKLAKRGVMFNKAYCQYPLCSPSRTSLLTGLNPDITGIYDLQTHFRTVFPDIVTLPELFKNNGYYSGRVGKIFHYGVPNDIGTNGLDDSISWQQRFNPKGRDKTDEGLVVNLTPKRGLGSSLSFLIAKGTDEEQTDGMVATQAIQMLHEHRSTPFFLGVGFFRPHTPYIAPKKYFDLYPLDKITLPVEPANDLDDIPDAAFFTKPANWGLSQDSLKQAKRAYMAAISFMDAQVGRVLDEMDRLKLWDNTIVVLWSDHGYNLGEHGQWMKQSLFENSARVPFIMSVPGGLKGKISDRTVGLIDIYPTLADLCGLPLSKKLSGSSLKPLLNNPSANWDKSAFSQVQRGKVMGRSIRTERYRYTEWENGKAGVEFYDEQNDNGEITNLANDPAQQEIIKKLSASLKEHYDSKK